MDASNDHLGIDQLDAAEDVVIDLDPLDRRSILEWAISTEEIGSMKLEVGLGAVLRTMAATDLPDVVVEVGDLCLVDDQAEDHVDRLVPIVEVTARVAGLVHVCEPHPASQPNPLPPPARPARRHLSEIE